MGWEMRAGERCTPESRLRLALAWHIPQGWEFQGVGAASSQGLGGGCWVEVAGHGAVGPRLSLALCPRLGSGTA